ncbi:energy-coupling factor transporter transmembrane component T [Alkalihalobacillus macyae]|uniref:energy-coupling factor transporter transmembrane component T family protein n=1 Tax=Guptibacillus hwajinpoensis TaxID=208199 RepID=UPI00273B605C|nr:energy-coupling factor transporter transmembrane component T [Alkalihalobacillus macyae]MDP4550750.1 energy-coupling factor transporter transmembrane component T [Alkalihalobacillus macyae]
MQWTLNYEETWVHRLNPAFKLVFFLLLFLLLLFIHNPNIITNITVVPLLLLLFSTGHQKKVLLILMLPFLLLFFSSASSMMFFGQGSTTWWKWGLIHITEESFYRGLHIGFRVLNFALLGLLFALTTRPVYLFYSLIQQLRVPPRFAYSFMAAVRILPVMVEEFQQLRAALLIRGVKKKKGYRRITQTITLYAVPLLSQSIRRAHRIAVAMEAKRFNNNERTYYYKPTFSKFDLLFLLYTAIGFGVAFWVGDTFPYFDSTDVRQK